MDVAGSYSKVEQHTRCRCVAIDHTYICIPYLLESHKLLVQWLLLVPTPRQSYKLGVYGQLLTIPLTVYPVFWGHTSFTHSINTLQIPLLNISLRMQPNSSEYFDCSRTVPNNSYLSTKQSVLPEDYRKEGVRTAIF